MILVLGVWAFLRALVVNSAVSLETVALRHQLAVLQRSVNMNKRVTLRLRRGNLAWRGGNQRARPVAPRSAHARPGGLH